MLGGHTDAEAIGLWQRFAGWPTSLHSMQSSVSFEYGTIAYLPIENHINDVMSCSISSSNLLCRLTKCYMGCIYVVANVLDMQSEDLGSILVCLLANHLIQPYSLVNW